MAKILYGAPVREAMKARLIEEIKKLGRSPCLAIIQVGDRADSNLYIKNKIKFGSEIGVKVLLEKFSEEISQEILENKIKSLGLDAEVDGIIVQLPLPASFDSDSALACIPINKDADGLTTLPPEDKKLEGTIVMPATARAVMALLDFYNIEVEGKNVAVVGRSRLAGGPIAKALEERGARVLVCHKGTPNTQEICKESDILVSAAGQVNLITKDFVKEGQVVVDVGINKRPAEETFSLKSPRVALAGSTRHFAREVSSAGKTLIVGDVAFEEVAEMVEAISPVPGGVGLLTVACLFENLLDICYNMRNS